MHDRTSVTNGVGAPRSLPRRLAALMLVTACGAMPMAAQQASGAEAADRQTAAGTLSLGLAGGFARALNNLRGPEIGYQALGTLEYRTPLAPLRLRADALFADFGAEGFRSLTANVLLSPLPKSRVAPYALAGAGAYAERGAGVKSGWTLGVGLRIPTARGVFVESRYHVFLRDQRELPEGVRRPFNQEREKFVVTPLSIGFQF